VVPSRSRAERLEIHMNRLRDEGLSYVVDTTARRLESELRSATTFLRRPVAKLFPYHFRLENIADTWLEAAARYRPGPYAGDAALFRASALSPLVSGTAIKLDEYNGWGAYVLGGVEVSACPGDHHNMCEQPNVRVLARRLRSYLDRRIAERSRRAPKAGPALPPASPPGVLAESRDTPDAA
jgi:thioesterase domain-containing protein